ncbi:RmlC-like cupin domain-containing protein [Talaromyces proteolyticus]|uniref:RmlC-like cupin domain-containing protein n=1 Tax=Talaromyces proteolyticus TaxID=1131652 RepID=A0AAD4Q390_9EURO|nr:RmlC-like cupin domain-containing protein [Talaromyces proteolyticus]KAH8701511.1 RmlC-like cupin domain-containing protein [Talaromyces proteolyticus]
MRWMISWVAGPTGYCNSNPGDAVLSYNASVGFMHLPSANRQQGRHYHSVSEIYIILRGHVLGYDGHGVTHRAGPLDCIYIPRGVPHGVRSCGEGPVDLIWVHDAIERKGISKYWDESMANPQDESKEEIKVLPLNDLEPNWDYEHTKEPGQNHWSINWVGGVKGSTNFSPALALHNDKVAVGLTVIPPGNKQVMTRPIAELNVVVRGKVVVDIGNGYEELHRMDAVYIPAGNSRTLRNNGDEESYIVWVHEKPSAADTDIVS